MRFGPDCFFVIRMVLMNWFRLISLDGHCSRIYLMLSRNESGHTIFDVFENFDSRLQCYDRFGSLAAAHDHIRRTAAFGGKADVQNVF